LKSIRKQQLDSGAMDLNQKFIRNASVVYREEEDGAFLFDPVTGDLRYMNHTAKDVFLLLDGRKDVNQVIEHLSAYYPEVEAARLREDVMDCMQALANGGLVSTTDTAPEP